MDLKIFCQSWATSTNAFSPKCISRFQRFHCILLPIHRFRMTSSKGFSKVWISLQNSWWTCDNKRLILKMILRPKPPYVAPNPKFLWPCDHPSSSLLGWSYVQGNPLSSPQIRIFQTWHTIFFLSTFRTPFEGAPHAPP